VATKLAAGVFEYDAKLKAAMGEIEELRRAQLGATARAQGAGEQLRAVERTAASLHSSMASAQQVMQQQKQLEAERAKLEYELERSAALAR
jgi:hypothetical protein